MLWSEIKKWANSNGVEVVKNGGKFLWRRTGVKEMPPEMSSKNKPVRLWDLAAKQFKSRRGAIRAEEAVLGVIVWNDCDELSRAAKDIYNSITGNEFVEHQENYQRG